MADTATRVLTPAEFREWNTSLEHGPGHGAAVVAAIAEQGWAPVVIYPGVSMTWACPSCGRILGGNLGDEPVSGWDNPRWQLTGTAEKPTLTPSLGCPNWREGKCQGHYWLRDGMLVQA